MTKTETLLVRIGGPALLLAMVIDGVAVVGRHVAVPLGGSIELVQYTVLIAGVVAIVLATATGSHATVHLLVDRISPHSRAVLARFCAFGCVLFYAAIMAGGIWVAADMWAGHEQSEVLSLPYRPLRLIANLGIGLVILLYLKQLFGRTPA
jgi:TRAP-type C4-dicarboxylate transport system permease small subunit